MIMAETIKRFHLKLMNNGTHITYVDHVLQQAEACAAIRKNAAAYLDRLRKAIAAEHMAMNRSAKSMLSDGIAEADASRGAFYSAFRRTVRAYRCATSAGMRQAAVELNQLLIDFRIDTRAAMVQETGMMTKLLKDLATKYRAQVETLGLGLLTEQMREANSRLDRLMVERSEERKHTVRGLLKAARRTTDLAYRELISMVNGLVYVDGEANYLEFVKFVNAEILYFRREALGQKGGAPKADGEEDAAVSS